MLPEDRRFDEICRVNKLGALATSENTHQTTLQACHRLGTFFDALRRNFQRGVLQHSGRSISVHLAFCANPSVNAFAVRDGGDAYFVGINTGTLGELSHGFAQLFTRTPLGRDVTPGTGIDTLTREQLLTNAAFFAALHFILSHELGHIAYGHADLLSHQVSDRRQHFLIEANTQRSDVLPAGLWQSMEVDADLYASSALVFSIAEGAFCGLSTEPFVRFATDMFDVAMIAVLTMFHLFYGDSARIDDYQARSHPLPEVRFLKFCSRAWQLRTLAPKLSISEDAGQQLVANITAWLPSELQAKIFPSLRLEGGINLLNEAKRVRANEDRYERHLSAFALIPVGGVLT